MERTTASVPAAEAPTYQLVPLTGLRASPHNARRHMDKAALKELVDSVKTKGVLEPILVRPIDGYFEVVAGYRRWKAAEAAALITIPAVIRSMDETEALELSLIENLQRADVHPLDEALGYRALLERAKYDVPGLAARIGKSTSYVYQRLKLADLIKPAQDAFIDDRFQAGHAILLARLQPKDQERALKALFERYGQRQPVARPVRDLAQWIEEEIHLDLKAAAFRKDDETLVPTAGACTTCPKRAGTNPALFPDIAKGDTCTDPGCFHAKLTALADRKVAALEADGTNVVRISTRDYTSPQEQAKLKKAGILAPTGHRTPRAGEYRQAGKEQCPHVAVGVVVDAESGGIGQTMPICAEPATCKVHTDRFERHQARSERADDAKQKAARRRQDLDTTIRRTILTDLVTKVGANLAPADLDLVARAMADLLHYDTEKTLCGVLNLAVKKGDGQFSGATGAAVRRHIVGAKPIDRNRFLLAAALLPTVEPQYWESARGVKRADLHATAKRLGVDARGITRRLTADAKQKVTAAAKRARRRALQTSAKDKAPKVRRRKAAA